MLHGTFARRHIGPDADDVTRMLKQVGATSLEAFIAETVPASILEKHDLKLPVALDEADALAELATLASKNRPLKSLIGQGYHGTHVPPVIQRNVLENPGWYTAYTPYQPEIAQGRLEVLFNFQTLVAELTGLPVANASLLDESTAVAEAIALAHRATRGKRQTAYLLDDVHPQTLDVVRTRCEGLGISVHVLPADELLSALSKSQAEVCAVVVQWPGSFGRLFDPRPVAEATHAAGALLVAACDPLAMVLHEAPAGWGCDIAVGSMQRFGVPMGFGGPHAAYMACTDALKRNLPGRLVGQSITAEGEVAWRLALQTREQHIRREKATSNICTAQALLAIMATLYACYHGPEGLRQIARRVRALSAALVQQLKGIDVLEHGFDTVRLAVPDTMAAHQRLRDAGYNARRIDDDSLGISFDETTRSEDVIKIVAALMDEAPAGEDAVAELDAELNVAMRTVADGDRDDDLMAQPCFQQYRSETEMMRYLRTLADKDLALDRAMIPLGSCTMKLNAAAEMIPVSWPAFAELHPFAPADQVAGIVEMIHQLEHMLAECTGYDAVTVQPNAGSQGEYAGLLAIRRYHESRGEGERDICLIPESAHGTNPASAQMAGMRVVVTACDEHGNIDIEDLDKKLAAHAGRVAAIMLTYPSTHGVFEQHVREVCEHMHAAGAQVYIDGANMNAMLGLARPGQFGGDVSHLNLHKTFCIPHGGGGPGVGPIGVGEHLKPFLPGHRELGDSQGVVSAAPYGSALILPISWMFMRMMGPDGLRQAGSIAILSANYIASRLEPYYPILYKGENGHVAHECILDTRPLKEQFGITVDDIAKRLMDYGFHAPTMSFPVPGTLMVEPTESESLSELDRFCDAMIAIHQEAEKVGRGEWPADDNPLHNAPHTLRQVLAAEWTHPYSREIAAWPEAGRAALKYWPPVSRVDNVYGDKHLICTCPPVSAFAEAS